MEDKDVKKISMAYDKLYDVGFIDNNFYSNILGAIERRMKTEGYEPILNQRIQKFKFKKIKG